MVLLGIKVASTRRDRSFRGCDCGDCRRSVDSEMVFASEE